MTKEIMKAVGVSVKMDRLLPVEDVERITGWPKKKIARLVVGGVFPAPFRSDDGGENVVWLEAEVTGFQEARQRGEVNLKVDPDLIGERRSAAIDWVSRRIPISRDAGREIP